MGNAARTRITRFALLSCAAVLLAGFACAADWPQWRGPNRDNKVTDFKAPATWPKTLTKKWSVTISSKNDGGESSPLLVNGKVYAFTRKGNEEVTLCLEADTGKEIWKDKYASNPKFTGDKSHAGPRSTPAIAQGKIVTLGVGGELSCLDAATGKQLWRKKTETVPQFNTASSPLIVDNLCVVYAGTLTAYDLNTGDKKWQAKGVTSDHASPNVMTVDGTNVIVAQAAGKSIVGVGMDGSQLWTVPFNADNTVTPIVEGQTILVSGKGGTAAFKVNKDGNKFTAAELWKQTTDKAPKYYTPVLSTGVVKDGLLFGMGGGNTLYCVDAKSGKQLWKDSTKRGECGHLVNAGPVIIYVGSDGKMVVFEASGAAFKKLAEYTVSSNSGITGPWSDPIITGNRVYVKDSAGTLTLWTID